MTLLYFIPNVTWIYHQQLQDLDTRSLRCFCILYQFKSVLDWCLILINWLTILIGLFGWRDKSHLISIRHLFNTLFHFLSLFNVLHQCYFNLFLRFIIIVWSIKILFLCLTIIYLWFNIIYYNFRSSCLIKFHIHHVWWGILWGGGGGSENL